MCFQFELCNFRAMDFKFGIIDIPSKTITTTVSHKPKMEYKFVMSHEPKM